MAGKKREMLGKTFNRLTVIKELDYRHPTKGGYMWRCRCICGNFIDAPTFRITSGEIPSCGCQRIDSLSNKRDTKPQISFDEFIKRFAGEDYLLSCEDWKGVVKSLLIIECKNHGVSKRTSGNLLQSKTNIPCVKCATVGGNYNEAIFTNNLELAKECGYIYYLKIGDLYKIGITINKIENRISALKSKSKMTVELIDFLPMNMLDAYRLEQKILGRFDERRIHKEWSTELFDSDVLIGKISNEIDSSPKNTKNRGENKMTNKYSFPATLLCDFYKVSHKNLYPTGTEVIYSTFTPRSSKHGGNVKSVVAFGLQGFVKKYLMDYFDDNFFARSEDDVINEYTRVIKYTLGDENPDVAHIRELHQIGYLPIKITALKEGTLVPIKVPMLTIENTHPNFFWLTNYLETLLSTELWQATTSATKAKQLRDLLDEYAMKTVGNTDAVGYSGHDFSMRGMSSRETAQLSGAGHLLSFVGTDTIPAILYLEKYYNANIENELVGCSVKATEHSIQSAYGTDELYAFNQILDKTPLGILSIVSDTYDFWNNVEVNIPALKDKIMSRDGKIVIRPDSGIPEDILCGNPLAETEIEQKGLVQSLWETFGGTVNELGYKELDSHIGSIYGDSINLINAKEILTRLETKGFASTNVVLGVGSYFYQFNTRDTFGFAMKATYAVVNGEERMLFKDPKTDDGTKKSQRGRVAVYECQGEIICEDGHTKESLDDRNLNCLLETVFLDGKLTRDQSLAEIREILKNQ